MLTHFIDTVDKQSERINRYDPCIEDDHKDKPQVKIISNPNLLIPYDNSAVNHKNNGKLIFVIWINWVLEI